jgi:hypothetical protein
MVYFPWCLEGLAALAVVQGDFERAAELAGARDTVFTLGGEPAGRPVRIKGGRAAYWH